MKEKYHSFLIQAEYYPEIIERILRVIRHRGYTLHTLNTVLLIINKNNKKKIHLLITVSSIKSINLLYTQLNKLINICQIITLIQ